MSARLIFALVGLRYKLLWAQTRTRNGRIAVFLTLYLFGVLILVLLTAGGYGAAMFAIKSGHAETVAKAVLGGLFVNALIGSVATGFGVNTAFTDANLRRFAMTARDRLAARHLTGIMEPIWILVFGLYLGLSTGMYVFGAGGFWQGAAAVFLLLIANYLCARVLTSLIDWLSLVRGGTAVLAAILFAVCILPGLMARTMASSLGLQHVVAFTLRFTPPFAAAALLVPQTATIVASSVGILAAWLFGLVAILAAIERQVSLPRTAAAAAADWDDRYERIASIFGPRLETMVARLLRQYLRSKRARMNLAFALPLIAFLVFSNSRPGDPRHKFIVALGAFCMAGFAVTPICTNLFGHEASGFRRYFLLPVQPGLILKSASYASLLIGGGVIGLGLLLWFLFAPVPFDPRMPLMLLASAGGGLLLFNGAAIWTSILQPRPVSFDATFGNQLSLSANIVVIGGALGSFGGAVALNHLTTPDVVLGWWWVSLPVLAAALLFYTFSLQRGAILFTKRRERMVNALEGRN